MRITKLSIDGFGLFDGQFELELPEGTALIIGDNETGKSTLLAAVGAILFGFETENERAIFAPCGTPSPRSGSLELEVNGGRYRFTRDFASNRAKIELVGPANRVVFDGSAKPRGRTDEKEAYSDLMRKLFGLETRDLFNNSVFVEQNSMQPELHDIVRRIVSGAASTDYTVALDALKETCENLTVAVPWGSPKKRKARRIETLETELQEKKRKLSQAREARGLIDSSKSRLASLDEELANLSQELEGQRTHEKDTGSFSAALEEKKRLESQLNEYRSELREIERLRETLKELEGRILPEYSKYASLPDHAEADFAVLVRLKDNQKLAEENCRQAESDVPRLSISSSSAVAGFLGLVLVAAKIFFLAGILGAAVSIIGVGLFAWAIFSAVSAILSQRAARSAKMNEAKAQLDFLRKQTSEIEARYRDFGTNDVDALLKELRAFKQLRMEKEKKEEALKQHPSLEQTQAKYDELSNALLVAQGKLDDLRRRRPSLSDIEKGIGAGHALEKIRADVSKIERRIRELESERNDLKIRVATAEASETVSEEALEEEIPEMATELDRLKLSREAHLLAIKTLNEAVSEFQSSHLARIEQKTSDYFSRIAGGDRKVRLNQELAPIEIEYNGQHFSPDQLSHGARDQLFFALRLAATEEVCGDIRLPILLDDPFVNFDETRLKATLQMLDTLSESHQIVLLTHDLRYRDWCEPVRFLKL